MDKKIFLSVLYSSFVKPVYESAVETSNYKEYNFYSEYWKITEMFKTEVYSKYIQWNLSSLAIIKIKEKQMQANER